MATSIKLFCYLVVYGILIFSIWQLLKSISASGWPKIKGEIIYSGVEEENDADGSIYKPYVEYKYSISGKEYFSKKYAFGFSFISAPFRFLSSGIVSKLPSKSAVLVSYNPKKHYESVLLTGIKSFHVFQALIIFVVLYVLHTEIHM
jgi:hypothetical protein